MSTKTYFLTLLLGVLGFTGTLFVLNFHSVGKVNVDTNLIISDSLGIFNRVSDTLHVLSPINSFEVKKHKISSLDSTKASMTYKQLSYSYRPNLMLWIMIISIGIGLAFAALPYLFCQIIGFKPKVNPKLFWVSLFGGIISGTLILFIVDKSVQNSIYRITSLIEDLGILFSDPKLTLMIVSIIFIIPNVLSIGGSFIVLGKVFKSGEKASLNSLINHHHLFSQFMLISSIMLVFGVLSSTFLRASVLDYLPENLYFLYPQQFVVTYSLIFSFFMLIFYMPGELFFRNLFRLKKLDLSPDDLKDFEQKITQINIFKTGLSILAPLVSAVLMETIRNLV